MTRERLGETEGQASCLTLADICRLQKNETRGLSLCLIYSLFNIINIMISTTGKMSPTPNPARMLSPACWVTFPTIAGPMLPPRSPVIAKSANIAVPPVGYFFDEMLIVPGHMIPTENPHMIHSISPIIGFDASDASK